MYRLKFFALLFFSLQLLWPALAYLPCSIFEDGPCRASPAQPYIEILSAQKQLNVWNEKSLYLADQISQTVIDEYTTLRNGYEIKRSTLTGSTEDRFNKADALDKAEQAEVDKFFEVHSPVTLSDMQSYYTSVSMTEKSKTALTSLLLWTLVKNGMFVVMALSATIWLFSKQGTEKIEYLTDLIARSSIERTWSCVIMILMFGLTLDDVIMIQNGEFGFAGEMLSFVLLAWSFLMVVDTTILVLRVKRGVYGFNTYEAEEIIKFARSLGWSDDEDGGGRRTMRFPGQELGRAGIRDLATDVARRNEGIMR